MPVHLRLWQIRARSFPKKKKKKKKDREPPALRVNALDDFLLHTSHPVYAIVVLDERLWQFRSTPCTVVVELRPARTVFNPVN